MNLFDTVLEMCVLDIEKFQLSSLQIELFYRKLFMQIDLFTSKIFDFI